MHENKKRSSPEWSLAELPIGKIFLGFMVLLFMFFMYSCVAEVRRNNELRTARAHKLLDGQHELRKFVPKEMHGQEWAASAGYFLFVGGGNASGGPVSDINIWFSWKMHDGIYANSKVSLSKVFVRLKDDIDNPTVEFEWTDPGSLSTNYCRHDIEKTMYHSVRAVIVTCKADQWPINIKMPLND